MPIPEASLRGIDGKFSFGPFCFDYNNRGKPRGIYPKEIQITKNSAKISVKIGDKLIIPNQVNYFSNPKDVTLYNDVWASTTLTPYTNKEILIDENFVVTGISKHGDNLIPSKGFVLSFPSSIALPSIKTGDSVKLNLEFLDKDEKPMTFSKTASMVTGIPMLVQASKSVVDKIDNKEGSHACTAIGIRTRWCH